MQPNGKVQTFEQFNASRKAREAVESDDAALAAQAEALEHPKVRRQRKPKPLEVPKEEASLADLLLQAVRVANNRKGRISQAEKIREEVLLDVLRAAMGR